MSNIDGESAMESLADKDTFKRLEKDLAAVKNDISALTDQITDALNAFTGQASKQARRGMNQARAGADSVMSDVADRGHAAYEAAYDAASSFEDTLEDVIQQRPIATVGLALGLGFLLGVTWRR